jgi:hypothetical protein
MVRIALFIGGAAALMIAYAPLLLKDENCCFKERKKGIAKAQIWHSRDLYLSSSKNWGLV